MVNSRLIATVTLFLLLIYALPVLCVPLPATGTTAQDASPMSCGGCHGHHQHAPAAAHNCCADHSSPAALQAATSDEPLNLVAYRSAGEIADSPDRIITTSVDHTEFSPPPPAVLRI